MSDPDLSHIRALIADDRVEARDRLRAVLQQAGVTRVDMVAAGVGGVSLLALMGGGPTAVSGPPDPPRQSPADVVSRFSHDVASPLMVILALSGLLIKEHVDARVEDDLKRIHAASLEVAALVRALGQQLPRASASGRPAS